MLKILEQHRLDVFVQAARQCHNMAHNTGLSIMRAGLLINAGALFTFPAFLVAFNKHELLSGGSLIISGMCYVTGLICAALCGYYAQRNIICMASYWEGLWGAYVKYYQDCGEDNRLAKAKILKNKINQAHKKYMKKPNPLRIKTTN